jgi:bifunctional non-homologous end joining protein LigD
MMRFQVVPSNEGFEVRDGQLAIITYPDQTDAESFAAKLNRRASKASDLLAPGPSPSLDYVPDIHIPECELLTDASQDQATRLLDDKNWWLQVKENGRRWRILKADGRVIAINRKNESVGLPAPIAQAVLALPTASCLLDGEEMPGGEYVAFDLLDLAGIPDLRTRPYCFRFYQLLTLLKDTDGAIRPVKTWFDSAAKHAGFAELKQRRLEGAVFKRIDAPFKPGQNGQHLRYKFVKSLTAKIVPKKAKDEAEGHDSAALALFDGAKWVEVAHASLIGKLKLLPPAQRKGWQWMGKIVEISYLYGYGAKSAPRLVQPRIVAVRDDQAESACLLKQVQFHKGQGE